jgi:hypothetical protein
MPLSQLKCMCAKKNIRTEKEILKPKKKYQNRKRNIEPKKKSSHSFSYEKYKNMSFPNTLKYDCTDKLFSFI